MRSGDDARRHGRERFRVLLRFLAQVAGAVARHVAKRAAESAETAPASVERDLADRHLRVPEQGLRLLDAPREQVAMRRHAEGLPELAREVRGGHVAHLGETRDRPLFVRGCIHAVFRAEEAAK
jgi:hypothetical protein